VTTADGRVEGTTQIVSSGSSATRWNLVLLSDGYQTGELPDYRRHCQEFLDVLFATAPFDALRCFANVYRVDVSSTDSGCDDPATCADGSTGSGATPRTYFDATLCSGGMRRLMTVNTATALATARAAVPRTTRVMVLVNTPLYGGSGGNPVGVASARYTPAWEAYGVAVHELGHTAFGLADEYGGCRPGEDNRYRGPEPLEPNVTTVTDRARLKWRARVAATTALPTHSIPDCRDCTVPPSPVPAGTVGLFEDARYVHCGIYRPAYGCMMRSVDQPFCVVCRDHIEAEMGPFRTPEPTSPAAVAAVDATALTTTWFDPDGSVTVTDTAPPLRLPGAAGAGFVQSRLLERAVAGSGAAGMYPYEYRVSLHGVTGGTVGVARMEIDVGPVTSLDYAGTGAVPLYEVTTGGLGDVRLRAAEQTAAGRLVLRFDPAIMPGQTSHFIGLVSTRAPAPAAVRVVDTSGRCYDLEGRAPAAS
jgi:hypothetical protein